MLILVTACFNPDSACGNLTIKAPKVRENQYKKAVLQLLDAKNVTQVLLCDNSNYQLESMDIQKKAAQLHKSFEYLSFPGDKEKVVKSGKGAGEMEILNYCFEHSRLLKQSEYFFKLTGRLYVKNIDSILEKVHEDINYFNLNFPCWESQVDTRFYGVRKADFEKWFLKDNFVISDDEGRHIENMFYQIIKNREIQYRCMPLYPMYQGFSASSGVDYEKERWVWFYNILARLGLLNKESIHKSRKRLGIIRKNIFPQNGTSIVNRRDS